MIQDEEAKNNSFQMTPLEVEEEEVGGDVESATRRSSKNQNRAEPGNHRHEPVVSPIATVARYILLTLVAVILTVSCADTRIHVRSSSYRLTPEASVEIALVCGMVMMTFFVVFRSDPGFITIDMMQEFNDGAEIDGRKIEGGDAERCDQNITHDTSTGVPRLRLKRQSFDRSSEDDTVDQEDDSNSELDPLTSPESHASVSEASENAGLCDIQQNGMVRTRRPFCDKCGFAPPLRSHHCKVCDKHVAMFDHHCHFIGTCIGERNHCRFWWFLTAQSVGFWYLMHTIGSSPYGFVNLFFTGAHHDNNLRSNNESHDLLIKALFVVSAKLFVYPLAWMSWFMWCVHTFLASTNSTTFEWSKGAQHLEYLKGSRMSDLPYSFRSMDQNLVYFCCQRDSFCDDTLCGPSLHRKTGWKPAVWRPPGKVVRDSEDWWEHPWQNKYWSCC